MSNTPTFKTINSNEILEHIRSLIDTRNLGEEIEYNNHVFYFSYYADPKLIFQEDTRAKASAIFASQIRQMLNHTGFELIVKQKHK